MKAFHYATDINAEPFPCILSLPTPVDVSIPFVRLTILSSLYIFYWQPIILRLNKSVVEATHEKKNELLQ